MKRIVVTIDRLVLHDFPEPDGAGLARGLEEALTRALAAPGAMRRLARLRDVPRLDAGAVRIARNAAPRALGGAVAGAIVKGTAT